MDTGLQVYPVFPDRPSDEYITQWHEHIQSTGYPETFESVTTAQPAEIGVLRLLSGEIRVPTIRRVDQALVPCPICHPDKPWFSIGRMAWFPDEKVVRFIGHDCAKRHFREHYAEAEELFRLDSRVRHLCRRWNVVSQERVALVAALQGLIEPTRAFENFASQVDLQARGFASFMYRELSRNNGRLEVINDTGVKDTHGNAIITREVIGIVYGIELWRRPFVPYQEVLSLLDQAADLERPLPSWDRDKRDEHAEEEIIRRGEDADSLAERIERIHTLLTLSQRFLRDQNLSLLERWGQNNNSPFSSLKCRIEQGRFVIACNTFGGYYYANPQLPNEMMNRISSLKSSVLTLRREFAQNRETRV